jgi:hypothetical protein
MTLLSRLRQRLAHRGGLQELAAANAASTRKIAATVANMETILRNTLACTPDADEQKYIGSLLTLATEARAHFATSASEAEAGSAKVIQLLREAQPIMPKGVRL